MSRGRAWAWGSGLLLAALAGAAIWKVQAMARADLLADVDPAAALAIQPAHAGALARLAETELDAGNADAAAATARELLRHEPLAPAGWALLSASAARTQGEQSPAALEAARLAVRHAPRSLAPRVLLADAALAAGDYRSAMVQLDVLMRLSPELRKTLLEPLLQQARVPALRDALADVLALRPTWRPDMLALLARDIERPEVHSLYAALRTGGGLNTWEITSWLDALIADGQWGAAYAHWASGLGGRAGGGLPLVYNGSFEKSLADSGFSWRLRKVMGSSASRQPRHDFPTRHAVRIVFQGRKVDRAGLEQPLLLPAGQYHVQMQVLARNLRSELGLEWVVQCADGRIAGRSPALHGNFGWQPLEWEVEVPEGCPGQWLRLRNPSPAGASRITRGELWVDDVGIVPSRPIDANHSFR